MIRFYGAVPVKALKPLPAVCAFKLERLLLVWHMAEGQSLAFPCGAKQEV